MTKSMAIIGTRGYPSYYGGFETAVRKLAPYLADNGWDVTVYGRGEQTKAADVEADPRIRRKNTPGIESRSFSTLSFGLTSVIHALKTKPDVVLVMNVANGFWLPLLRLRGIPTLVNVDGMEWERAKWGRVAKMVFRLGAHFTARFADELVADAKEIQRRWKAQFRRDSTFIPYGGDEVSGLVLEEGLEHRSYVLVVARFVPENTIQQFLEASDQLAQKYKIVVVGTSGYGGELDEMAEKLSRKHSNFKWLGRISDDKRLFALWEHAGAYFHGHSVGGTNPALVQAMATGAPIVALDTVFNREVLGDDAIFTSDSPDDIRETIEKLMESNPQQEKSSEANLKRGREMYSWDSVLGKYRKSLDKLTEHN
ncbi:MULTISPECIES: glycosyltransferase [Arthrobacter]|uniref:Glycosyltransferase n=1 Tax=Arthrobacter terricola TaxID=2547396 RepID=A0A4V2ZSX6_9MICC|nr:MULTISPECIES: glycosyltransferase [Arthrobacter]MBT8159265.1 glycosyltransferase [Arthrobacter sp. GN70]TDF94904.1 glycosyltransferase [Arthrobacter terricola]